MNSADAWLFLPGVKPSLVASTYLQQMQVNGVAAGAESNVRVVQYGQNGAVMIPQSPTFQPLTVFSQAQFGGTLTSYSQWTYYTGIGLTNIKSPAQRPVRAAGLKQIPAMRRVKRFSGCCEPKVFAESFPESPVCRNHEVA